MVVSIKFAAELRDKLYGLNLSDPKHLQFYQEMVFIFIKGNENEILQVYKDIKGYNTIGIGFNMDNPRAKIVWQTIFQGSLSFDKVYNGDKATKLTLCKVLNSVKRVNVTAVAYNDLKALTLFDKPSYLFCVQFFLEKPTLKMHN